ncbi:MAG TPA: hypothetical protein VHV30_12290 [Polyangiaceae bacterium]|jgi:hypothetical protein|nr:hypothetical protein [Polyangiaceae bacterium]
MNRAVKWAFAFVLGLVLATAAPPAVADAPAAREEVAARFAADAEAQRVALDLFDTLGDEVDVLPPERVDGGYRGMVTLVPALPVGPVRKHLAWVAGAMHDFDWFFGALAEAGRGPLRYRWRELTLRFYRSVGNTTPNAFASEWTVAYNVNGSLDTSADRVRETLFHEIFHLDDAGHDDWSPKHLTAVQDAIERRCGTRTACLAPYAPTATIVRRGTYYAFQPGNDVHEYAAEVALRWYEEQRAALRGEPRARPSFKCGPRENGVAWAAISAEFFGGVDLVPPC